MDNVPSTVSISCICRICHGSDSSGDLLKPCKCKGSIALAHIQCLERWLSESNRNECELCQYNFKIIRQPKYSIPWSILVFLRHPGDNFDDLILDTITLAIYTPSAITSSYMLLLLCESLAKSEMRSKRNFLTHLLTLTALFGIAAINFTYASWFTVTVQKHIEAWRNWYRRNCTLKVVLSDNKLKPIKVRRDNK